MREKTAPEAKRGVSGNGAGVQTGREGKGDGVR